jgi:protein-disulfide isomerase
MSSRSEAKQRAREARQERERAEAAARRRRRRLGQVGAVVLLAAVVVVVAIVVSQQGGEETPPADAGSVNELFAGIPQDGTSLGDPDATVVLTEFADLQCPFCAEYARNVLPELVNRYVRPGRVRLEFRTLTFIGPDSERAGRAAAAAAQQDKMWQFTELFYRNQGAENSGYVTDEFVRGLYEQIDGLDVDRAERDRDSPEAQQLLDEAASQADQAGIDSTPSFLIATDGGQPQRFEPESLEVAPFTERLDQALGG